MLETAATSDGSLAGGVTRNSNKRSAPAVDDLCTLAIVSAMLSFEHATNIVSQLPKARVVEVWVSRDFSRPPLSMNAMLTNFSAWFSDLISSQYTGRCRTSPSLRTTEF
jgi:hypothetical protein